jgi:hypothetical protein
MIENETLIPVADAVEALTGRRPSRGTVWQWTRNDTRNGGARLETIVRFGRRLTSVAAVERFEAARANQSNPNAAATLPPHETAVPPQPVAVASSLISDSEAQGRARRDMAGRGKSTQGTKT